MSNQKARTHTQGSNRAKAKDGLERKPVYKSVLDHPFRIRWPSVPINLQNSFLAQLISLTDGVAEYHRHRDHENRKRKKSRDVLDKAIKKRKIDSSSDAGIAVDSGSDRSPGVHDTADTILPSAGTSSTAVDPPPLKEAPSVTRHLTVGINAVTKKLESQIKATRCSVTISSSATPAPLEPSPAIKIVFVCRADVDPPLLIDHLPHLVAAFNSSIRPQSPLTPSFDPIKLVPLPKGAESSLAEAMGLRRAAVIALDVDTPGVSNFSHVLESVPTLAANWLVQANTTNSSRKLVPTHIKQVRTSAPKDMKASKELRAKGKIAAKERRKHDSKLSGRPLPSEKQKALI